MKIGNKCCEGISKLYSSSNMGWKYSTCFLSTATGYTHPLILCYYWNNGWNIYLLTTRYNLRRYSWILFEIFSTECTNFRSTWNNCVRIFYLCSCYSFSSFLSSWFLSTLFSETLILLRNIFFNHIRRWRFRTIT